MQLTSLWIFPHWYRRRLRGWWMFGCLRTDIQHELISDLSGLMKEVLYVFFSPTSFNLAVGMRLPLSDGFFNISIKNGPNIQDLKAHQAMTDSKGTSGTHCCIKCKAVLNIDPARIRKKKLLAALCTCHTQPVGSTHARIIVADCPHLGVIGRQCWYW